MRVRIGPYKNYLGPYQIAELLLCWMPKVDGEFGKENRPIVSKFGNFLAYGTIESDNGRDNRTWFDGVCEWVHSKRTRRTNIHIDDYDTWNAHNTASMILYPLLKRLNETNVGYFYVKDEDAPEQFHSKYSTSNEHGWDTLAIKRYEYVMEEILFALKSDNEDWEEQFRTGNYDLRAEPSEWDENGNPTVYKMVDGPNHTAKVDFEGIKKYQERIDNGFRLMGVYYQSLWS